MAIPGRNPIFKLFPARGSVACSQRGADVPLTCGKASMRRGEAGMRVEAIDRGIAEAVALTCQGLIRRSARGVPEASNSPPSFSDRQTAIS
jgi:hypothetical protein